MTMALQKAIVNTDILSSLQPGQYCKTKSKKNYIVISSATSEELRYAGKQRTNSHIVQIERLIGHNYANLPQTENTLAFAGLM